MQRVMAVLAFSLAAASAAPASEAVDASEAYLEAQRDFDAVRSELGLSGSAPLVGLEKYEFTVRPQVAYVILATAPARGR